MVIELNNKMKNNLFVNILFLFMAIPLVFLSVNFYLGTQDYAIEQFNNHALSVICGTLCLVSIVLSIIILVCLVIDLFFNIYKKTKKNYFSTLEKYCLCILLE